MTLVTSIFGLLYIIFIVGLFGLCIYALVTFIKFMKQKQASDHELNEKLSLLIEEMRSK
ncbi:DUF4083 family protein [Bacillus sp. Marseille-Q3570]|uniref:DUF4083 family protein n=1 Tax=Bacillus sp. Marseille-Q3570 TaxID=2963522 RepID=UPI0021B71255|nr:DUF4083 family protein [Bacillus sp. Marseille-Q3570]